LTWINPGDGAWRGAALREGDMLDFLAQARLGRAETARRYKNVPLQELAHQLVKLSENSAFMSRRLGERQDAVGRCKLLDDRVTEDLCDSRFAPDKSLRLREV